MGDVILFRPRPRAGHALVPRRYQTPEQLVIDPSGFLNHPHENAVYESSLGYLAPDKDPA